MGEEHKEPAWALARELTDAKKALELEDLSLCRRVRKVAKRVKVLEEAGVAVGKNLDKIAFNAKVNNYLTSGIILVLVLMLTRQWPELWPAIVALARKLVGL